MVLWSLCYQGECWFVASVYYEDMVDYCEGKLSCKWCVVLLLQSHSYQLNTILVVLCDVGSGQVSQVPTTQDNHSPTLELSVSFSSEFMKNIMYSHIITPHYGDTTFTNLLQKVLVVSVLPLVAFSYYFVIIIIYTYAFYWDHMREYLV